MNIAPDVNCPHCGMVITCPHTLPVSHPPHCINPRPARRTGWLTVRGPGRCTECSFHVATQGHRDGCGGTAPVEGDAPDDDWCSFLDRVRRHKAAI